MLDLHTPLDIWGRFRKQRHSVLKVAVVIEIKFLIWEYFLRFHVFSHFLASSFVIQFSTEN